jgi:hypothetical protein
MVTGFDAGQGILLAFPLPVSCLLLVLEIPDKGDMLVF